ncbi:MAG TPA: flagellar biosynthesis anti-sigma factor FlgM [Bryobacteraceae bacterium]|nr:flagellar biosynthesis anti-sigma factor FlgM [Bryobacteraceae bacterium]
MRSVPVASKPSKQAQPPRDSKREARIAELRRQYRAGTYTVNAEELSAKIVEKHIVR